MTDTAAAEKYWRGECAMCPYDCDEGEPCRKEDRREKEIEDRINRRLEDC